MAAHQYWRLTGFLTDSNALELSQAQLYDGVQLIAQAPTFTVPPTTGTAFPEVLRWDDFSMPGFALVWTLATPVASPSLRLGAGPSADTFPKELYCQYSDDGLSWSTNNSPVNIAFPGVGLLTAEPRVAAGVGGLPTYRHFRFKVLNSDHPLYLGVFEITAENEGVPVSLLGKTYSANVSWIGSPVNVFDGNFSNYLGLEASQLPLLLDIDLRAPTAITDFTVFAPTTLFNESSCAFHDFDILGSNDGAVYDTLATIRGASPWLLGESRKFKLQGSAPLGYVFIPLSEGPVRPLWRLTAKRPLHLAGAPMPAFNFSKTLPHEVFMDAYHGGLGLVRGTVKEKHTPLDTPLRRLVLLMEEAGRLVIRKTWSDPVTGAYEFRGIKESAAYSVLSYDHTHDKRAVIADNLTLENGGVEMMA